MSLLDRFEKFVNRAANRLDESGTKYEPVDVSAEDYTPAEPFRAIHISTTAGDVVIKGLDGVTATLALEKGTHSLGGMAIMSSGTDAEGIVAIR